jgi:hypothetical protein
MHTYRVHPRSAEILRFDFAGPSRVIGPIRRVHPRRLNARRLAILLREVRRIRGIAQPTVPLISIGPVQQRFDGPHGLVDAVVQLAEAREPLGHRGDREILGLHLG